MTASARRGYFYGTGILIGVLAAFGIGALAEHGVGWAPGAGGSPAGISGTPVNRSALTAAMRS